MKTLTNTEFAKALKQLEIIIEAGEIVIQDEAYTVASYNRSTENSYMSDTISIFGDTYQLTEKQQDAIASIVISESESYMYDVANAWCQADRDHAINLIYS
jgi:diaminopimelate decarboxylase